MYNIQSIQVVLIYKTYLVLSYSYIAMHSQKSFLIKNDYTNVIEEYAKQKWISTQIATNIFNELMKFLWIASISNEAISPSRKIDNLRHYLLEKENLYKKLCIDEFWCYLDHVIWESVNIEAYKNWIRLYEKFFNNHHTEYRPKLEKNTKEVALCTPTKQIALCIPTKH